MKNEIRSVLRHFQKHKWIGWKIKERTDEHNLLKEIWISPVYFPGYQITIKENIRFGVLWSVLKVEAIKSEKEDNE